MAWSYECSVRPPQQLRKHSRATQAPLSTGKRRWQRGSPASARNRGAPPPATTSPSSLPADTARPSCQCSPCRGVQPTAPKGGQRCRSAGGDRRWVINGYSLPAALNLLNHCPAPQSTQRRCSLADDPSQEAKLATVGAQGKNSRDIGALQRVKQWP